MDPVIFGADFHVGNHRRFGGTVIGSLNRRCRETIESIRYIGAMGKEHSAQELYVLGDVFDVAKPSVQVSGAVDRAFGGVIHDTGMEVSCLVGNHDLQSTDPHDHSLSAFTAGMVTVYDSPHISSGNRLTTTYSVPYQPGDAREWLEPTVAELAKKPHGSAPSCMCIHLGIYSEKYVAFVGGDSSRDAVPVSLLERLMDKYDIDACFAGNWHTRKQWKTKSGKPIVQVGATMPTGWSDAGMSGYGVTVWHPVENTTEHVEIVGPRFLELPRYDWQDKLLEWKDSPHSLYVRGIAKGRDEMRSMVTAIEAIGAIADVRPDQVLAKAAASTAAVTARSADTREAALEKFIKAMPIEDNVSRQEVMEKCKRYLSHG